MRPICWRRALSVWLAAVLVFADAVPALAYLKFGARVNGRLVTLKWNEAPVRYFVTEHGVPGVGPTQLQGAVSRAFETWQRVSTASISYQFGGYTAAQPGEDDSLTTLGFLERPELDRVLASTSFLIDAATGVLVESDVFFNAAYPWSVVPGGENNRFDLETIALHEIGHLSGLGHSALGETELGNSGRRVIAEESVMFPIAFPAGDISNRTLRADDIAGISDLYPDGHFSDNTGSVSGRVTKSGQGLFGAHVVAFNPSTGALVGNFSLNAQGQFSIVGLSPGPQVIRVEPLDDVDLDGFFDSETRIDLDFRVTFFDRLVIIPRGGDSSAIEIKVIAK